MSHGFRRNTYQVLPESGAKVTCVEINDSGEAELEWFLRSLESWGPRNETLAEYIRKSDDEWVVKDWDFVLVVPLISVRRFWCANDGMTAWRRRQCGYTIPDHCRQTGGCPEVWNSDDVKGKRELLIANPAEIEEFVVLDHAQVRTSAFPEARSRGELKTS